MKQPMAAGVQGNRLKTVQKEQEMGCLILLSFGHCLESNDRLLGFHKKVTYTPVAG